MAHKEVDTSIALVSMPWSLFTRPSVQLGSLKAYLEKNQNISVDCLHPYLGAAKTLSPPVYTYLCKKSWAGEALYSALLFGKNGTHAEQIFKNNCRDNRVVAESYGTLVDDLESHLEEWLNSIDFAKYLLIGFSVCFSQFFSSLAAARKIKQSHPNAIIVFGGSTCVEPLGQSLVDNFDFLDFVLEGEGEKQLEELIQEVINDTRHTHSQRKKCCQEFPLDKLPCPNYDDYFKELEKLYPEKPFSPTLPIEFSRGCWWGKCAFCNLNLQWKSYRRKTAEKMISEVKELIMNYGSIDFSFCDNALPPSETDHFFKTLSNSSVDLSFFAEIRAINDPEKLSLYKQGGLEKVQAGIESFSTGLLKKMKKGTTTIENLAVMKHCMESSIVLEGNLLVEFPGSSEDDVSETLSALNYAWPYHPLQTATFFLGTGSDIEKRSDNYPIQKIVSHPNNTSLFPENGYSEMAMLIKDYVGDKTLQKKIWQPVKKKVKEWQKFHEKRNSTIPPLSYRNGGSFILIRQESQEGQVLLHRLYGASKDLYLYCATIRTIDEITTSFQKLTKKSILNFFTDLSNKRLLFREGKKFLSLAIHNHK